MAEEPQLKWEGKHTAKLRGPTADQVWPLLEDFCTVNKWLPGFDTCYQVEGVYGQPGLIRYCASTVPPSSDGGETTIKWSKEKLIAIDPNQRCLSYEALDNTMGFKSYVSTIKVSPINGGDEKGCVIEWSYVADPVEGFTYDAFDAYIDSDLQYMADKMGKTLQPTEPLFTQ